MNPPNSPEDSIEILISTVYQRNLSSVEIIPIRYDQLMEGPLGLFLGIEGTNGKGHQLLVIEKMNKIFGNDIRIDDRKGHPMFKIICKYEMEQSQWIYPAASNDLRTLEELKPYLTGSKIVFKRVGYYHTGVLLHKTDGELMIIELSKTEDSGFRMKIRSAGDVLGDEPSPMMIDNNYLHGRGVDINKLFYRFSRIAELEVAYNATQMNCDVCSTYLTTGWTNWSTMKKFHRPFTNVSIPVNEGQITRLTLEQLTAENSML